MNEKQEEASQPSNQIIKAYKSVFGVEGKRTAAQDIVWKDMTKRWRLNTSIFVPNMQVSNGQDGLVNVVTYDTHKAALTDGARLPILQIKEFVEFKEAPKEKPNVKK